MSIQNILIDVGNTRIKWAVSEAHNIVEDGVFRGRPTELGDWLREFQTSFAGRDFSNAYIASVANKETTALLKHAIAERFNISAREANTRDLVTGFSNGYQQIENLGVDRWLAAIGARRLVPQGELIIVDAGTAVTIDWMSSDNEFKGGVILPGARLMLDALIGETANIDVGLSDKRQIIGKTTSECVNSGIAYGSLGAIERIITEMRGVIPGPVQIVVTGGARFDLVSGLQQAVVEEGRLVLIGLIDYFENC